MRLRSTPELPPVCVCVRVCVFYFFPLASAPFLFCSSSFSFLSEFSLPVAVSRSEFPYPFTYFFLSLFFFSSPAVSFLCRTYSLSPLIDTLLPSSLFPPDQIIKERKVRETCQGPPLAVGSRCAEPSCGRKRSWQRVSQLQRFVSRLWQDKYSSTRSNCCFSILVPISASVWH